MQIQVNSDKSITVDAALINWLETKVNRSLQRFSTRLTRVVVHLSDENSHKFGTHDKRCLIEARPARHGAVTATNSARTVNMAVSGALTKLRSSLQTAFDRLGQGHEARSVRTRMSAAEASREATATAPMSATAGESLPVVATSKAASSRGPKKKGIYQARRKNWPAR